MFPRLLHLGNFNVPTYGFMAALGLIFGLMLIVKLGREQGLDPEKIWNLGIIAIVSGIVGAKLLYFVTDAEARHNILSFSTLQAGGVWSGGVVLALIMCIWYMRVNGLPVLRTCDVFAPGIALGHAFGRVGCFAAGCCFGKETHLPWAVTFHNPLANQIVGTPLGIPLHPTQLYEMLLELCNAAFLVWLIRRKKFEGEIIGTYMIIYGIGRYFIEFFRGDPGRGDNFLGFMTGTQVIAICLVIFGGFLWMRRAALAPPVAAKAAR